MDHLTQLQGQDWLSFSTKASDQEKSVVLQLLRLGAGSCLEVAHKGSAFHRKQKGGQTAACACPRVITLNLQPTVMCCC